MPAPHRIITTVISTKGGEGKSTVAGNLAGFTADSSLKTLLIDGDYSQSTASSIFRLAYEAPAGIFELLTQPSGLTRPEQIISRTEITNLDLIISNDPDEHLPSLMLHSADGRLRMRDILNNHPLFEDYDVIIIDSKGAAGIMVELLVLAASTFTVGVIKPVLPDVREFLRGTVRLLSRLLTLKTYGITTPAVRILVNCLENTNLDRDTLQELNSIIDEKRYLSADEIDVSMLKTRIELLEIYKQGHARGLPVHRLESKTSRKSDAAAMTMYLLACELFPHWQTQFNQTLNAAKEGMFRNDK